MLCIVNHLSIIIFLWFLFHYFFLLNRFLNDCNTSKKSQGLCSKSRNIKSEWFFPFTYRVISFALSSNWRRKANKSLRNKIRDLTISFFLCLFVAAIDKSFLVLVEFVRQIEMNMDLNITKCHSIYHSTVQQKILTIHFCFTIFYSCINIIGTFFSFLYF